MVPDSSSQKISNEISVFFIQKVCLPRSGKRKSIPRSGAIDERNISPCERLSGESAISTKILAPFGVPIVPKPLEGRTNCPEASREVGHIPQNMSSRDKTVKQTHRVVLLMAVMVMGVDF